MLHCLFLPQHLLPASQCFTEALPTAAEALPKTAKPQTAQVLQPSSFQPPVLQEPFFIPPHAPLKRVLWEKALCDYGKIMVQETAHEERNRQFKGPKGSWGHSIPLCSSLYIRKETAVPTPPAEALYHSGAGATRSQNVSRRTGITQQLILQTKFFGQCLSIKSQWYASPFLLGSEFCGWLSANSF